jgi:LPS export ABC transporter permease LptF/LPS export ABC transporter permease LptG
VFRLLGRYVFREVVTSALLGTLLATFIIFLEYADKLFAALVSSNNVGFGTVLALLGWTLPPVLPLTIPFGVLVGILIGLGRMAADGEIVAMRAAGVSSRAVIAPVLAFAALGMGLAAYAELRLTPLAYRQSTHILNDILATQLSAEIEPRVFNENFPNRILYVDDVIAGQVAKWKGVFVADITPPEQRQNGMRDKADGPMITLAREAIAVSDPHRNRIELTLEDYTQHEMGKDRRANDSSAPFGAQALDASPPDVKTLRSSAMNTRELLRYPRNGPDYTEVQIELHKRFSLPVACITLALVGIPLGVATRKGGKSAGYVIALFLGFFCYNLSSLALIGVAKQHTLPVPVALWLPNAAFFVAGVIFLYRMETPGDRDLLGWLNQAFGRVAALFQPKSKARRADEPGQAEAQPESRSMRRRLPLLPQILDTYLLSSFLFYLAMMLASLVLMLLVYNFFDLMGDMVKNKIPLSKMFTYLFFLTPELIYELFPFGVLVAVLVQLGVLSKQNEITAFRACGVSLFRLAMPILVAGVLFSGALFAFDHYYVPGANRKQDALRDVIKNRPTQTYYRSNKKWIMGYGAHRIYYYDYFDTSAHVMLGVNVFELDPRPGAFRLQREIVAQRATWSPSIKTWVFENGWTCTFVDTSCSHFTPFSENDPTQVATFQELTEPPEYFLPQGMPEKQMTFLQLDRLIRDLEQRGYPTGKQRVQLYLKFAGPIFALIMAMIAVPFGFRVGSRGAMAGIGQSLAIGVSYRGLGILFEKVGDANLLPPTMAAFSPDVIFGLAGLYLLLRMRS